MTTRRYALTSSRGRRDNCTAPGAHGINDDRITAFMRGYLGGVDACALPAGF
jgi:hypothetical protein